MTVCVCALTVEMNRQRESRKMDNYNVQFVFDYCVISASCHADSEESAPDLAWDWLAQSGVRADMNDCIDIIVNREGE